MNEHEQLVDRAARHARTVLFIGGMDAGKSTLARATAAFALRIGRAVAYLDADVAQKTVGPPATVGMKHIRGADDLTLDAMAEADALGFVGSTSPQDHLVPLAGALQRLRERARTEGADLVVVDTGGEIGGIRGQLLSYYEVDVLEPDLVVGLTRGEDLEPILGIVDRFFGVETATAPVHPETARDERRGPDDPSHDDDGSLLRKRAPATVPCATHGLHAHAPAAVRPDVARPAARGAVGRRGRVHGPRGARARPRGRGSAVDLAGRGARRKRLDWGPFAWRTTTAPSGWTSGPSSEPSERLTACRR